MSRRSIAKYLNQYLKGFNQLPEAFSLLTPHLLKSNLNHPWREKSIIVSEGIFGNEEILIEKLRHEANQFDSNLYIKRVFGNWEYDSQLIKGSPCLEIMFDYAALCPSFNPSNASNESFGKIIIGNKDNTLMLHQIDHIIRKFALTKVKVENIEVIKNRILDRIQEIQSQQRLDELKWIVDIYVDIDVRNTLPFSNNLPNSSQTVLFESHHHISEAKSNIIRDTIWSMVNQK